jgi:hypothetical protein
MSSRTEYQKFTPLRNATIDGVTTQLQAIAQMRGRKGCSLSWSWTSTLVTTALILEVSPDWNPMRPAEATWIQITDPAIVTVLSTGFTTPAAGNGMPNGTAGSCFLQIDPIQCDAIRFTVNRASSSGTFTLTIDSQ